MNVETVKIQGDGWLVNGTLSVPNDESNRHYQFIQDWLASGNVPEPEFTQEDIDEQILQSAKKQSRLDKLAGVNFNGVMCSATKEDMWGLNAIEKHINAGNDVNFEFSNGNVLVLNSANVAAFEAVWIPFRASFF